MTTIPFRLIATTLFVLLTGCGFAQSVLIQNNIALPQDTAVKNQLLRSLNGFITDKEKPNDQNPYILKEALLPTSALVDEMKGIDQSTRAAYKCYLTNCVKLSDDKYIVQLSYLGVADGQPLLKASFRIIAKKAGDKFLFYSPLTENTSAWKARQLKNITFYYKDTLNTKDAKAYQTMVNFYDKKLKAPGDPIIAYYCDNFPQVLQLLGVDYKADYNGVKSNNLTGQENKTNLVLNGWNDNENRFDPHDLFHERLRTVMANDMINRGVDEGCAYLYGGSWGIAWPVVLTMFKKYAAENPKADWLQLYIDNKNFSDGEKPLKSGYLLNALIIQKLEKEKGFEAVKELLACGKRQKGDDNYFKVLYKLTGINKANFNVRVWQLINAETSKGIK